MRRFLVFLVFCLALSNFVHAQDAKLTLNPGDHVSIVGNALADRMQFSGELEALLTQANADKDLVFRNLGFAADEVATWHRSENFGTQDEWLGKTGADVIFAFFGFNESFQEENIEPFKANLDKWLKEKKAQNYGGATPRIVLFSPIAVEDTGNPDHPIASPLNSNLAAYTEIMAGVAKANDVPFIDLFQPSLDLYAASDKPLTHNAIHLNEEGYRQLAPVMFKALTGQDAPPVNVKLRDAINEKNLMWHSRYRTVDGYNVYGGRSGLAYKAGEGKFLSNSKEAPEGYVSNYQVMQQEMAQRDVLTANRDQRVWAIAKGGDLVLKDDNLPPVTPAPTNLPPERIAPYPDGEEAIKTMKVHSNMKVNLFASEKEFPELANPVQMMWDTKNRLWIAAWPTYPEARPTDKVMDKILIFEDANGDGKADKMTTFMDGLNCPTGFQLYKDGILLMQAPDLWFVRDTDGDGKADWKERVLNGMDSADSHHTTNAMCYDPGGSVYLSDGVFHRTQVETARGPVRNSDGSIYRFEPRTGKFEHYMAHSFANPHGRVFDYWGNDLITDATGNATYFGAAASGYTTGGAKHARLKEFWARPSRPCPATAILSSAHFPDEFQGNFLNANVISFQGIYRVGVRMEGSGLFGETLEHLIYAEPAVNQHFRPICMANGPDGALYFCDWAQTIIGHMQHHIRDPHRDHQHGRIYRITYEGRPLAEKPLIAGQPIPALLELLKSPINGTRELAKVELDTHSTSEVIPAVKAWAAKLDPKDPAYAHHLTEALWVHQWHNVVDEELLRKVLTSPEPNARAAAGRVLCYWRDRVSDPIALMRPLCTDDNPRVRLEGIRMASFFQDGDAIEAANATLMALNKPSDYYLDYITTETMKQLERWWRPALTEGKLAPGNPAGVAYLMKSVNTKELLAMPKIPIVLTAWLSRPGIPEMKRMEALAALTEANKTTMAQELVKILESPASEDAGVSGDLGRLLARQIAPDLKPLREKLQKLASSAPQARAREAALAAMIVADGSIDPAWDAASSKPEALTDVIGSVPLIADPALRAKFFEKVKPFADGIPAELAAKFGKPGVTGRYVRISLPRKGTLTLAEVEVMSDGKNVAKGGSTGQSSRAENSKLAIDGNKSGKYGDGGQTHTNEDQNSPWWELDLGNNHAIDSIGIWNRTEGDLWKRLEGFDLEILDGAKRVVFEARKQPAPAESVVIPIGGDPAGKLRRAAIAAMVSTKQQPEAVFTQLTALIRRGDERTAAARAIRQIPTASWNQEQAGQTALSLLEWAKTVPAAERTSQDFIEDVQVANSLAGFLPEADATRVRKELRDLGVSVYVIRTVHEQLRYDTTRLVVQTGKPFEISFINDDVMPHNLLVVNPGTHGTVGMAAQSMLPDKLDRQGRAYVPADSNILSATKLLEPGQHETLKITAPAKPGDYEYVCTFPGHWMVMWGKLIVTDDVDAYLKAHPVAEDLPLPVLPTPQ